MIANHNLERVSISHENICRLKVPVHASQFVEMLYTTQYLPTDRSSVEQR